MDIKYTNSIKKKKINPTFTNIGKQWTKTDKDIRKIMLHHQQPCISWAEFDIKCMEKRVLSTFSAGKARSEYICYMWIML